MEKSPRAGERLLNLVASASEDGFVLQGDIRVGGVNPKHTDGYIFALAQEGLVSRMSVAVTAIGFEMADVAASMGEQSAGDADGIRLAGQRRDLMRDMLAEQCPQDARFLESMAW